MYLNSLCSTGIVWVRIWSWKRWWFCPCLSTRDAVCRIGGTRKCALLFVRTIYSFAMVAANVVVLSNRMRTCVVRGALSMWAVLSAPILVARTEHTCVFSSACVANHHDRRWNVPALLILYVCMLLCCMWFVTRARDAAVDFISTLRDICCRDVDKGSDTERRSLVIVVLFHVVIGCAVVVLAGFCTFLGVVLVEVEESIFSRREHIPIPGAGCPDALPCAFLVNRAVPASVSLAAGGQTARARTSALAKSGRTPTPVVHVTRRAYYIA